MENSKVMGLLRAKGKVLAHVIETVLDRIPTYDDLQNFTRAVVEDDPYKEVILYNNQAIGVMETSFVMGDPTGKEVEVKFKPSFAFQERH